MRTSLIAALLALVLLGPALGPDARAQGASDATLVINLTSDDVWTQQMALSFAGNYWNTTDNDVVIFLGVRAVGVANAKVPQHTTAMTENTPQQLLSALVDDGGKVFLCQGCTKQAGLSVDDRIDGVEPSGSAFLEIVAAPGTRIISY